MDCGEMEMDKNTVPVGLPHAGYWERRDSVLRYLACCPAHSGEDTLTGTHCEPCEKAAWEALRRLTRVFTVPSTPRLFFSVPESRINLPGADHLHPA